MWPREAVAELKRARELVADRRAGSIEAALRTEGTTVDVSEDLTPSPDGHSSPKIERLLRELINENRAMRRELHTLRDEVAELRALPPTGPDNTPPRDSPPRGGFWRRFRYYWHNPD